MNPAHILIIEDDEFLAFAYQSFLAKIGYQVSLAHDGNEGLKKLREEIFDLVILDLAMPHKSGIEVLEELKKNPLQHETPIIVASNYENQDFVKQCLDLGAKEYFIKSNISINKVGEICERYLKK